MKTTIKVFDWIHGRLILAAIFYLVLSLAASAFGQEKKNEFRLFSFAETAYWRVQVVLPNMAQNFQPLFYIGPRFKVSDSLSLVAFIGNIFKGNENVFKLCASVAYTPKNILISTQWDYNVAQHSIWNITQFRYIFNKWWLGAESENTFFGPAASQYLSFGPCIGIDMSKIVKINLTYFFQKSPGKIWEQFPRIYFILNLGD